MGSVKTWRYREREGERGALFLEFCNLKKMGSKKENPLRPREEVQ